MDTNRNEFQGRGRMDRPDWMENQGDRQGRTDQGGMDQNRMGQGNQDRMGQGNQDRMGQGNQSRMGQGNMSQGNMDQNRMGQGRQEGMTRQTRWHREAMTARDIMTSPVRSVTAQGSVKDVAVIMRDENCGIVTVVDEGKKLVGVVTDRDLVVRALAEGRSSDGMKIQDLMTEEVEAVAPDEELRDIIELMGKRQVRRIPVVDEDDTLLGIISLSDIANRADYDEELQEALSQISAKRSFWSRRWL